LEASVDEVVLARCRLTTVTREGGTGKVPRAHDSATGRDGAVDVLPTDLTAELGCRKRSRNIALAAARPTESQIAAIDLHGLLLPDGPISPQHAVHVISHLAATLQPPKHYSRRVDPGLHMKVEVRQ
jgi:serine/threonine protein kinase, bacterial